MRYLRQVTPETRWRIGSEVVILNALVDDLSRERPAYIDGDGRLRVNSAALLHFPYEVSAELIRLGNGRWSATEVVSEVVAARKYVHGVAAANGYRAIEQ